ncbi:sulfite exporter TauE/SafE family protein [Dyadobacter sp. CY356]|uniref:sulfite exporter TauE/SafE family protein n=1 Tax=Dyadobacter sp. CY356 TaxID=2906442 RepID=UPI001F36A38B|nr:sulfite exporter TauE/SafE family protein [Dyadobacter sp. CY356]MCF0058019.1 sulfite exporter TauE/SafE family protein [Dyadobacter sp. CY356]
MNNALPYLALSMGLLSSFHCIAMCGPIALALPVQKGNKLQQFSGLTLYNTGRTFTYASLGIILGSVGSTFTWIGYLRYLSIFSGILMLLYVLWPTRLAHYFHLPIFWQKFIQHLKKQMGEMLRSRKLQSFFLLGILNGLLPCGLVYLALISSIATGNAFSGGLYMLMFGIGTLPAMMAVGFFKQWFSTSLRSYVRKLTPIMLAIAGIILVMRGIMIEYPVNNSSDGSSITICHGK